MIPDIDRLTIWKQMDSTEGYQYPEIFLMVPIISELDDASEAAEVPAGQDHLHHDRPDRVLGERRGDFGSGIT